ncbi:helix-turn-helix domain-containing protein [Phenylobacterium montanum]|uniref:Helix-turn-helix transcriptional regulator n=1 Tax=Phenylobacterium montanum TaxID=2823693 RepID=A0A975G299_9CAUL|nr:XRE family transcriptional regulator [Caulobacter sp. S6]QUD89560.1 helix-turn-helix transcriptional regulator [Caulobacter sp. S6]
MIGEDAQLQALLTAGAALKDLRSDRGWTLAEVSRKTGVPVSTLSKIENGKTTLTLERLLRLSSALGVNLADVIATPRSESGGGDRSRRAVTRLDDGEVVRSPHGEYKYHALDLLDKPFTPMVADISARSIEEFGEFHRHKGQEFVLVIEGELLIYSDTYAPLRLKAGESVYFDSGMGHAYVNAGPGPCRIVSVFSTPTDTRFMKIDGKIHG